MEALEVRCVTQWTLSRKVVSGLSTSCIGSLCLGYTCDRSRLEFFWNAWDNPRLDLFDARETGLLWAWLRSRKGSSETGSVCVWWAAEPPHVQPENLLSSLWRRAALQGRVIYRTLKSSSPSQPYIPLEMCHPSPPSLWVTPESDTFPRLQGDGTDPSIAWGLLWPLPVLPSSSFLLYNLVSTHNQSDCQENPMSAGAGGVGWGPFMVFPGGSQSLGAMSADTDPQQRAGTKLFLT